MAVSFFKEHHLHSLDCVRVTNVFWQIKKCAFLVKYSFVWDGFNYV
jgi:hypothetical protein